MKYPSPLLGLKLHSDTLFSDNQLLTLFDPLPFFSKKKPFRVVSKKLPKWLVRRQRACSHKMLPFKTCGGLRKENLCGCSLWEYARNHVPKTVFVGSGGGSEKMVLELTRKTMPLKTALSDGKLDDKNGMVSC
jgi:hypothetical protein